MAFSLAGRLGVATTSALLRRTSAAIRCLATSTESIADLVKGDKVVVFMKGVPESPRCGFSNAVVQVFRMHGVQYKAHDVMEDENLRQGIKAYSNWPTIPQVYIDGQFVGGCDILLQMHQNGELIDELAKVGIKSLLVDAAPASEQETTKK